MCHSALRGLVTPTWLGYVSRRWRPLQALLPLAYFEVRLGTPFLSVFAPAVTCDITVSNNIHPAAKMAHPPVSDSGRWHAPANRGELSFTCVHQTAAHFLNLAPWRSASIMPSTDCSMLHARILRRDMAPIFTRRSSEPRICSRWKASDSISPHGNR